MYTGTLTKSLLVRPGYWIFGDADAVLVIPVEILQAVVEQVAALSEKERLSREAFQQGATFREVFERYNCE